MTSLAEPTVRDELDRVVSELRTRFSDRTRIDIESVVNEVYAELAARATVTAHLIPLTLNRSRRILARSAGSDRPMQAVGSQ
ncbi:hypothetical protein H7J93_14410 [Mycobacterium barrassiae]|uniref:three-helix bundle dimerization domain-containing protein n=1 Tax=Mycobacterium barrassiae TaxID=319709 RepID=UPI002265F94C|nr:hypothetical protein [Mycobacterium barrassiae]MCV7300822.1 hypothetical protein [Mycobacterium barrassiae]